MEAERVSPLPGWLSDAMGEREVSVIVPLPVRPLEPVAVQVMVCAPGASLLVIVRPEPSGAVTRLERQTTLAPLRGPSSGSLAPAAKVTLAS